MFQVIFFVVLIIFPQNILASISEDDYDLENTEKERLEEFINKIKSSYNKDVDPCFNYVDYVSGNLEPIRKYISPPDIKVYKDIYNLTKSHLLSWDQMFNSCYYHLSYNFEESVLNVDLKEIANFKLIFNNKCEENAGKFKWYEAYNNLITLAQQLGIDVPIYIADHRWSIVSRISLPILVKFNFLDDKSEPEMFRDLFENLGYSSDEITNFKTTFKNLQQKFISMDDTILDNMNSQYKNYMIKVNRSYVDDFKQICDEADQKDLGLFLYYIMYGILHETHYKIIKDKEICYKFPSLSLTYSFMTAIFTEYLNMHDKEVFFYQSLSHFHFFNEGELSVELTREIIEEKWTWEPYYHLTEDYFFLNVMKVHKFVQDNDFEAHLIYFNLAHYIHNEPKIFMVFYMWWIHTNRYQPKRPGSKCHDYEIRKYFSTKFITGIEHWLKRAKYHYDPTKQILEDNNLSINKISFTLVTQQLMNQNWTDSEKRDFQNVLLESPEFLKEYICIPVKTELDC